MTKEVSKFDQKSQRLRERIRLALPAQVRGRESPLREWTEMVRLVDVTPFGARFQLARPTEPGRLLHLTMAMPRQLRVFDHMESQYRIWALVRNVRLLDKSEWESHLVEVGVAFIGKRNPQSYEENPAQRYEISQTQLESGLWGTADSAANLSELETQDEDQRKDSRQLIPVDLLLEVFADGKVAYSENTVTENISQKGAAVFTSLEVAPNTFVRVSSERQGAVVLAAVRGIRKGEGIARLHLEFIGGEWPL